MVVKGFDIRNVVLGEQLYLNYPQVTTYVNEINVVFCTDDGYCKHMGVTMASILLNTHPSSYINFHIFNTDISKHTKFLINKLKEIRECGIFFYDVSKYDVSMFPVRSWVNRVTYFCLLCDLVLPPEISKVIYLDCDLIVEDDLTKLWNVDLGYNFIAAAEDEDSRIHRKRLELQQSYYFNTGVMLLNLENTRPFQLFQKCKNYFYKYSSRIKIQAQDLLNAVLDGKFKKIHLRWNATASFYLDNKWNLTIPPDERWKAIYNPAILHYTYVPKPWQENCQHPLKNEYFKYLSYTPFSQKASSFINVFESFYN